MTFPEIESAGATLTALPALVVRIAAGCFFVRGPTAGAVKG